jgi:murein DD-endopeptidase MepM/ murein hydrolase activator NlpD
MKISVSILSLFLVSSMAFATGDGTTITGGPDDKGTTTPKDTIPFSIDEDELTEENDSIMTLPSDEVYGSWDTLNIHPYRFDIKQLNEISIIPLCSESSCGYVHPFSGGVTSNFGPRRRRFHYGIDIDLETGDLVGAAFDGKVRIVKKSDSYGNVVVIRHNNGLETFYAHLSKTNVEVGQDVFAGDVVGLGGNTGHSHGSHLHFEVRYMGQPINPSSIISFNEQKLISNSFILNKNTFSYIHEAKKLAKKSKGKNKIYIVRKGDTLSIIARKYGTSVQNICKKNRLNKNGTLRKGQKIKV